MWEVYDELIAAVPDTSVVVEAVAGIHWFAVRSEGLGLALNPGIASSAVPGAGRIAGMRTRELATWIKSWDFNQAAFGLAAINSALNLPAVAAKNFGPALDCEANEDTFGFLLDELRGKKVAVIGHFRTLERVAAVCELSILERRPSTGDLPDPACEYILPSQDVVIISGSTLINKTLPRLLQLSRRARVALIGPSTPLAPLLFKYGVGVLGGLVIMDQEPIWQLVREGGHHELLFTPGARMLTAFAEQAAQAAK